jgi:hypothetical protein
LLSAQFWLENEKERYNLGDLGIDGRTVLVYLENMVYQDVSGFIPAQITVQWWAVVNTVTNLTISGFKLQSYVILSARETRDTLSVYKNSFI